MFCRLRYQWVIIETGLSKAISGIANSIKTQNIKTMHYYWRNPTLPSSFDRWGGGGGRGDLTRKLKANPPCWSAGNVPENRIL